jgi:hypothetical protein
MPTMEACAVSLGSGDDAAGDGEQRGEKRKGEIKAPRERASSNVVDASTGTAETLKFWG